MSSRALRALPAEAWRYMPELCATCGGRPTSRYRDGSPAYSCRHDPLRAQAAGSAPDLAQELADALPGTNEPPGVPPDGS